MERAGTSSKLRIGSRCWFLVAGPFLDHRPLTLAEQAAIAGGEKGKTCGTPAVGTACHDTDTVCPGGETACSGKMFGDACASWNDFQSPKRRITIEDETQCCDNQGQQTQEQVECVIVYECQCEYIGNVLWCSDKTNVQQDRSLVFKCVSGSCPD